MNVTILLITILAVVSCTQITANCSFDNGGMSYSLPVGSKSPRSVVFSPNGAYLATANGNNSDFPPGSNDVTMFSVKEGGVLSDAISLLLPLGSKTPNALAFSPDSWYLATANKGSNDVTLFDVGADSNFKTSTSYPLPPGSTQPVALAFSPNGLCLATANSESTNVTLFHVMGGQLSEGTSYALPSGAGAPVSIAFSPNGSLLAVANQNSNEVTIFSVDADCKLSIGKPYALPSHSKAPSSASFSPDGLYLATANTISKDITVFSVGLDGSLHKALSHAIPSGERPQAAAFSPNGMYLAIAFDGSGVGLFNVDAEGTLSRFTEYSLPPYSVGPDSITFSPNSLYLATANIVSNDVTVFGCHVSESHEQCDDICRTVIGVATASVTLIGALGFCCALYRRYNDPLVRAYTQSNP